MKNNDMYSSRVDVNSWDLRMALSFPNPAILLRRPAEMAHGSAAATKPDQNAWVQYHDAGSRHAT